MKILKLFKKSAPTLGSDKSSYIKTLEEANKRLSEDNMRLNRLIDIACTDLSKLLVNKPFDRVKAALLKEGK